MAEAQGDEQHRMRLKAALHLSVGKASEATGEEAEVSVGREVVAALTEAVFGQLESFGSDLEAFARHAKRKEVTPADVLLLLRQNPDVAARVSAAVGYDAREDEKKSLESVRRGRGRGHEGKRGSGKRGRGVTSRRSDETT